jgi:O-antigen/teichoic acid export membrane protein
MPGLGAVIGQRDFPRARELRAELMALTWLFGAAAGAAILVCNRSLLTLWIGAHNYAGFWANLLIVLTTLQTVLVRSDAYVLDAALQPRMRVIVAVIAAVVIVGLSLLLTPRLGIIGICLGMLIGRATQSVAYPVIANRALGGPRYPALVPILRPALATTVLFLAAGFAGERVLARNWFVFAALVLMSFGACFAIALTAGLSPSVQRRTLGRARAIVRGLRRG